MDITRRTAGIGLVLYTVGSVVGFTQTGPGGDFEPGAVHRWMDASHRWTAFGVGYLGCFAAVGLLVFAVGAFRRNELCRTLAVLAAGIAVVGWFLSSGMAVAFQEGGATVRAGVPLPVVYTLSEVANLVMLCAPAFCLGVIGWVLAARGEQPRWLRILGAVGGTGGILAAFYFPIPLYLIWLVALGVWTARSDRSGQRIPAGAYDAASGSEATTSSMRRQTA